MDYQRKRRLTHICIGLIFLFSGIEYAVILPTIWAYLQTLHAEPYFLGLGLAAFSFSGLLAGPVFGQWSDKTLKTKPAILFGNLFEIAGNFMYFVGISKWLLLASRLVAGIGTGAVASIFGYLTRATSSEERATVFAAVMACRQFGLLIGPAFNLFLRYCNFHIGPFVVNKYTAPGLFMCFLWILLQVLVVFMYSDLQPLKIHIQQTGGEQEEEEKTLVCNTSDEHMANDNSVYGSMTGREKPLASVNGEVFHPDEDRYISNGHIEKANDEVNENPFQNFSATREYLREEVVVLLTAQFITLFNQTALETMVTPLTQKYFGFGELENSIMYFLCGAEVIAGFVLVRCLSTRFADRVILAVGLVICNISCIWCIIFLADPKGQWGILLAEFIIGVFLQVLGLPFVAVSQISLFSKVTAEKTQGFSQGLRRSVGGIATILGPLWAGGLTQNLYVMLAAMMALLTLLTVMMGLSYKYLVEPQTDPTYRTAQEEEEA
ncbi:major facilitator superfamily domain-containing protein 8-like isoform X1 [Protopterus annectens]|uniref:major facilitator superfamily domain-containing protein 8-like isoform X1 n=1 Tax=Protopterus annectens TaxID=7888 RepID=UPI001CF9FEB4|nr:major facilitator superfamily domain-containing protein 8-like isoform X1 [Protopterus annectens]